MSFISFSELSQRLEAAPHKGLRLLQDCRAGIMQQMRSLATEAKSRVLTTDEKDDFDIFEKQIKVVDELLAEKYAQLEKEKRMPAIRDRNADTLAEYVAKNGTADGYPGLDSRGNQWIDSEGRKVQMLAPKQQLTTKRTGIHFGRLLLGMITGNWRNADAERAYLAQAGGINTAGGYLVPEELSREILDLARAQSVVMRAGARTFEMTTDTLILAKQTADATFSHVGENQTIPESELTFGALTFSAKKVAAIVTCSNELLQDAPNAADKIQSSLVTALAVELDRQALVGSGSLEFEGLTNNTLIGSTGSVGGIEWVDINTAAVAIMTANYRANAYIVHPDIYSDATLQTTGDGTNSAKNWLPPPPIVAELTPLITTAIGTADITVGQFDQAAWGVRLGMGGQVQFSQEAGTAFEKYQTKIRCVFRGDFLPLQTGAFHNLTGITT